VPIPVPTPEEMLNWYPDQDPKNRRFRVEVNVQTGERKEIELTLEEYRERHVAKIMTKNEREVKQAEEVRIARRKELLETFIDELEAKDI